ncbi:MAG: cation:proton antiporter [Candidatus Bathyarchaeia archaeon]
MPETLIVLSAILVTAFLLNTISRKIGFPSVVGQILAGMILGIPVLKAFLFNSESLLAVDLLSTFGIVFLLFLAGLEIDIEKIKETTRDSALVALGSTAAPFILGFTFLTTMGYSVTAATVFGGALAVTAGGTIVGVLMDLNVLNTRLGAIFVAAGTIDDLLEVILLSIIAMLIHGESILEVAYLPLQLLAFVAISFALFKTMSKILDYFKRNGGDVELFSIVVILVISMAALSEILEIGYLIGAIMAGFLLQISMKRMGRKSEKEIVKTTRLITLAFVVPFFFANIGLNFDIGLVLANPALMIAATVMAIVGAIGGVILVKPFSRLSLRQLHVIGWAMSSKGSVELVVALLARKYGLVTPEIFSALVGMAIITTLAFPFVLEREIKRNPSIMNAVSAKHKQSTNPHRSIRN